MKVLVTAASRHGSTVEIAASIGATLRAAGHEAFVLAPEEVEGFAGFDAAVIGSAIYVGRWLEAGRFLIESNKSALRAMPVWLFASGPVGDPPKPADDPEEARRLVELAQAREHRLFPGSIDKHRLGFAEKAMIAAVRASEGDFRPWPEIEAWARGIAGELTVLEQRSRSAAPQPELVGAGR
jgi:menaquinone-dependent protoporphyrinogen oxidase